jgi:hypothetical protein
MAAALALTACGDDGVAASGDDTAGTSAVTESASSSSTAATPPDDDGVDGDPVTSSGTSADTTGSGIKLDVGVASDTTNGDESGPADVCHVVDDMNGVGDCDVEAPPDSFEAELQWGFAGEGEEIHAIATPLVANMNDDNGDGSIDLCDTPDVIVVMWTAGEEVPPGHIYILDGETGAVNLRIDEVVDGLANPAVGDIDGDGLVEIVTLRSEADDEHQVHAIAFEHDGTLAWESAAVFEGWQDGVSLADLDADGDVEIMAGEVVLDHTGALSWQGHHTNGSGDVPTAADLDDDGDLEVLMGARAYYHDGTPYYTVVAGGVHHPQVANLDDDPQPEVFLSGSFGLSLLQHDGTPLYLHQIPIAWDETWQRPAAVHDIDGDGTAEIIVPTETHLFVFEPDLTLVLDLNVFDYSGDAAATAFDFLGDGSAEAVYGDEMAAYVFDQDGTVLLDLPRFSATQIEYPVVADVDNDESAEIVVVSNGWSGAPAVQVFRDVEDRWIQARRIWNQHAYHVTNVREDGTIPQVEPRSWELLNTFRTNAQIEGGAICNPRPAG